MRGLYDENYCKGGYPPGYFALSAASQILNESMGRLGMAPSVETLRLLGVVLGTLGIFAVGMSARLIAGALAGLIAAALWALNVSVVEYSLYAIPESVTIPLASFALLFALIAWQSPARSRWVAASVFMGLLAALFDYRFAVFLLPGWYVFISGWLQGKIKGWRGWLTLGFVLLVAFGAVVGVIVLLVPSARYLLINALTVRLWNISGLLQTLAQAHEVVGLLPALIVYGLGLGAILWQRTPVRNIEALILCLGIATLVCVIGFTVDWDVNQPSARIQHILPASAIFCILAACAISYLYGAVSNSRTAGTLVLAGALILFIAPQIAPTINLVQERRRESTHVLLRRWVDNYLEPGTIIVNDANHKTFNPFWGGIPHRQWFDWWVTKDFAQYSLAEWRARGMSYMLLPVYRRNLMAQTPDGSALLDQMLPLVEFNSASLRGPEVVLFRLWRMEHEVHAVFGSQIELIGYDGDFGTAHPGDLIRFRPYWQVRQPPALEYSLFVHLIRMDDVQPIAQFDGAPGPQPTYQWSIVNSVIIGSPVEVAVPPDVPPDRYRLRIGLYDFHTGERLPVVSDQALSDALDIAELLIAPEPAETGG